jgi:hypothetical protein
MASNIGVMLVTIAMFKETGGAQLPADGVNVYVVVPTTDVLMLAGFHVPVIPSFDVVGSTGAVVFWQYEEAIVGKVGVMVPMIVMLKETGIAQLPVGDGVNL